MIQHLGTDQFKRIRIGIGRPNGRMSVPNFVLQRFTDDEMIVMDRVIDRTVEACETFLTQERFENIMNQYNGDVN